MKILISMLLISSLVVPVWADGEENGGQLFPQGEQGIQGPKGDTGNAGTNGTNGLNGPTGAVGQQGLTGSQGATGVSGKNGTDGVKGDTGAQGKDASQVTQVGIAAELDLYNHPRVDVGLFSFFDIAHGNLAQGGLIVRFRPFKSQLEKRLEHLEAKLKERN
jgi:hypothetical protein